MIACIIIVGLALYWLGIETEWLTIDLLLIDIPDIESEYDDSDIVHLDDYEYQSHMAIEDYFYNLWLATQHQIKYTNKPQVVNSVDPKDKWMATTNRNESIGSALQYTCKPQSNK